MTYVQTAWYDKDHLEDFYLHLKPGFRLEFSRRGYFHWAIYVGFRPSRSTEDDDEQTTMEHCIIHRYVPPELERDELMEQSSSQDELKSQSSSQDELKSQSSSQDELKSQSSSQDELKSQSSSQDELKSQSSSQDELKSQSSSLLKKSLGKIIMSSIKDTVGDFKVRINNELDSSYRPKDSEEIVAIAEKFLFSKVQLDYSLFTNNCEHFANQCRYGVSKCEQIRQAFKKLFMSTMFFGASAGARVGLGIIAASTVAAPFVGPAILIGGAVLGTLPWVIHGFQYVYKKNK